MRREIVSALIWIAASAIHGCAPVPTPEQGYASLHGASGIRGRPYDEITNSLRALANQHQELAEVVTYGTSLRGRPLTAMRIADKRVTSSGKRPAVLISEGIHGNEFLNISDRLPGEFLNSSTADSGFRKFLAKGGVLYVVPVINPDGYTADRRENARGQDLNRDFTIKAAGNRGFSQPETKGIADFMSQEHKDRNISLEMSMEYHCCIGGLIHPWAYTSRQLEPEALKRHTDVGQRVKSIFGYRFGTVREIVGYEAIGGSDDYYFETYGRRAFTFEGAEGVENRKLPQHVRFWNEMFETIAAATSDETTPAAPAPDKLYLALSGTDSGTVTLYGATPAGYESVMFCLGATGDCTNGDAIVTIAHRTTDVRKIFKATRATTIDLRQAVTMTATKAGVTLKTRFLIQKH